MPNVFEVADRIHIQRLGGAVGVIDPNTNTMDDAVAYMTGARKLEPENNLAARN
jgi:fructose transport system ATP-binding protein